MSQHRDGDRIWPHVIAGAGAGWMTAFVTCPLDVVKTRLQTNWLNPQKHNRASSITYSMLSSIWRVEGLRGMYRGLGPTLVGYLPSFSIYFPAYHFCKVRVARWRRRKAESDAVAHVSAAMLAGAAGNLVTNPLWVVRTRLMTQHVLYDQQRIYSGTIDAFRSIMRNEGIGGFYKGAIASVIGVLHVAVQFPLYEWLKQSQITSSNPALSPWNILIASTISKVVASTATYPHEIIRTRLQVQREGVLQYSGVIDAARKIWHEEGLPGFYRGLRTNIIRVIPASGVTFLTYELIVRYLSSVR
jgi:solute carrier family 25 folate transporter 32